MTNMWDLFRKSVLTSESLFVSYELLWNRIGSPSPSRHACYILFIDRRKESPSITFFEYLLLRARSSRWFPCDKLLYDSVHLHSICAKCSLSSNPWKPARIFLCSYFMIGLEYCCWSHALWIGDEKSVVEFCIVLHNSMEDGASILHFFVLSPLSWSSGCPRCAFRNRNNDTCTFACVSSP